MHNYGRQIAYDTFRETLLALHDEPSVTEVRFRDAWLERMRTDPRLYLDGWYAPPPDGLSVLFANGQQPNRISFHTLRDEASWPSERAMNWKDGLLFAYCSPVDTESGLIGDFAITLYFGTDPRLQQHFATCYAATQQVLAAAHGNLTAREFFESSQQIFSQHSLENAVVSSTDTVSLDLGHTFPSLAPELRTPDRRLSDAAIKALSTGRRFISDAHDWRLGSATQFTVEPQLRSTIDPSLPQITFHYVVLPDYDMSVLAECDDLFRLYGLLG